MKQRSPVHVSLIRTPLLLHLPIVHVINCMSIEVCNVLCRVTIQCLIPFRWNKIKEKRQPQWIKRKNMEKHMPNMCRMIHSIVFFSLDNTTTTHCSYASMGSYTSVYIYSVRPINCLIPVGWAISMFVYIFLCCTTRCAFDVINIWVSKTISVWLLSQSNASVAFLFSSFDIFVFLFLFFAFTACHVDGFIDVLTPIAICKIHSFD